MHVRRFPALLLVVGLLAFLPAFTNIRLTSLQPVDVALLLLLGFCSAKYLYAGFSFRISADLSGLFKSYVLLLLLLFSLSMLASRLTFYPLEDASFLKRPVIYSLSKLLQFASVVCGFLWATNVFLQQKKILLRALGVYWVTGVFSALYAILCYLALSVSHSLFSSNSFLAGILGAYFFDGVLRARGFFNEGGPFGIYLVSVFVVGFLRRKMTRRSLGFANVAILSLAFVLAASKAGFFAAALLALYAVMSAASFRKKIAYLVFSIAILWGIASWLNFGAQLSGYIYGFQNIDEQVAARGVDMNLVAGRIAALYIVPKMIAAHPITGIGFGNYPLMRNDPHYLGVLPSIRYVEDVPGIGIPGIAAEMGIPATLWLMLLMFIPYWAVRKRASILAIAAIYQPLAHTFAVQLTFFYPWFVSACAFAASVYEPELVRQKAAKSLYYMILRPDFALYRFTPVSDSREAECSTATRLSR